MNVLLRDCARPASLGGTGEVIGLPLRYTFTQRKVAIISSPHRASLLVGALSGFAAYIYCRSLMQSCLMPYLDRKFALSQSCAAKVCNGSGGELRTLAAVRLLSGGWRKLDIVRVLLHYPDPPAGQTRATWGVWSFSAVCSIMEGFLSPQTSNPPYFEGPKQYHVSLCLEGKVRDTYIYETS